MIWGFLLKQKRWGHPLFKPQAEGKEKYSTIFPLVCDRKKQEKENTDMKGRGGRNRYRAGRKKKKKGISVRGGK